MCGITGVIQRRCGQHDLSAAIIAMRDALTHRGPDAKGAWLDGGEPRIALGHRRLAINDLSRHGEQPMHSEHGRYVLVFNGEIYNFVVLRRELIGLGHRFRGSGDTEVVLAGVVEWGLRAALERFEGMFALALWDCQQRCLFLARDRYGEKPLYYGGSDGVFLFGSELKALRQHPGFSPAVDRGALSALLRYSYIPAPLSIFTHYRKLPPASILRVDSELNTDGPRTYWSLDRIAAGPALDMSDTAAVNELERLLVRSIDGQMCADVPVGAFLSGGIDSSLIVALVRRCLDRPISTFTIGFDNARRDEAVAARQTAAYLGTDHHELYLSDQHLRDIVPALPAVYDEPFADSSQIPTVLASRFAGSHVKVALSGDGGDELFAGYKRYAKAMQRWHRTRRTPAFIRRMQTRYLVELKSRLRPEKRAKYLKTAQMQRASHDFRLFYMHQMSFWSDPGAVVLAGHEPPSPFLGARTLDDGACACAWMMTTDALGYLPDDILTKVDRAAMAASLETRAPFLDSALAEFAFRLPTSMKYRGDTLKWLPRQLLARYMPAAVMDRPKKGFGAPLKDWLRGPLRDWGDTLLEPDRLRAEGYFDADLITRFWREHRSGRCNWTWPLWSVLMFQAWHDSFFHAGPLAATPGAHAADSRNSDVRLVS